MSWCYCNAALTPGCWGGKGKFSWREVSVSGILEYDFFFKGLRYGRYLFHRKKLCWQGETGRDEMGWYISTGGGWYDEIFATIIVRETEDSRQSFLPGVAFILCDLKKRNEKTLTQPPIQSSLLQAQLSFSLSIHRKFEFKFTFVGKKSSSPHLILFLFILPGTMCFNDETLLRLQGWGVGRCNDSEKGDTTSAAVLNH